MVEHAMTIIQLHGYAEVHPIGWPNYAVRICTLRFAVDVILTLPSHTCSISKIWSWTIDRQVRSYAPCLYHAALCIRLFCQLYADHLLTFLSAMRSGYDTASMQGHNWGTPVAQVGCS